MNSSSVQGEGRHRAEGHLYPYHTHERERDLLSKLEARRRERAAPQRKIRKVSKKRRPSCWCWARPHNMSSFSSSTFALGPIIALLMQGDGRSSSYVPASYVKWIEMAGARVIPLPYHATDDDVDALFPQVNGALFPGGGSDVPRAARRMYEKAVEAHKAGDHFPIWGTCDGFEWLMQIASGNDGILSQGFDSENISLPLNFTAAATTSALFADAQIAPVLGSSPKMNVMQAFGKLPITLNNHMQGVTPSDFASSSALVQSFRVLATNVDRAGKEFVSVVEGRAGLPIFATQFHPEKNIFEQGVQDGTAIPYEAIAHSRAAVAASQYMANFFIEQARRSTHRFTSPEKEWSRLIYQYNTSTFMAPAFTQVYYIDEANKTGGASEDAGPERVGTAGGATRHSHSGLDAF